MIKPQTLKGFRDFLPENMQIRNYVKNILINVFESFGYEPLETPTLEYASTLLGKYGDEADKLIYSFDDNGGRKIGLRYDLTVPVSKVLAIYGQRLPLPFKRYQIQPVWRSEKPQKGRYREFYQCDIDAFGPKSPTLDAEIITIIYNILSQLKFSKFSIRINSRAVLYQILEQSGAKKDLNLILQSLDKFEKIGVDGVTNELISKNISSQIIDNIFGYIKKAQPDEYLQEVFDQLKTQKIPQDFFVFDPTMVRGLDYYTGPIFETYVSEPKIGSLTGGGRYDNLIRSLGGPDIPAVGTTFGMERLIDAAMDLGLFPDVTKTSTTTMVVNFSDTTFQALELCQKLRSQKTNTLFYPYPDKLSKQFKFASDKSIPFVAILGPDEISKNIYILKDMSTGEQKEISLANP